MLKVKTYREKKTTNFRACASKIRHEYVREGGNRARASSFRVGGGGGLERQTRKISQLGSGTRGPCSPGKF